MRGSPLVPLALLLAFAPAARAESVPALLELSVHAGKAPLAVRAVGPATLLEKAKECRFGFAGVGFWIDWGDGARARVDRENPDCTKLLEHTYTVAGSYEVKAQVVHPGPTDAPVTDWEGASHVNVAAGAESRARLSLLDPMAGRVIHYGEGFPAVRYELETSRKGKLELKLLGEGGRSLFEVVQAAASSGEGSISFTGYGNGPPAADYRNGKIKARLALRFEAEGVAALTATSKPFQLRANATFRELTVKPEGGVAPLAVEASAKIFHPDCYSYVVDWGDHGPPERATDFVAKKQCPIRSGPFSLTHVYRKKGTYVIRWQDNDGDPFHEALEGPGYLEQTVRVR